MIYEYECQVCHKKKEVWQKVDDPAPKCCGKPMKKLISSSNFILKGSGWYKTDYANPKKGKKKKRKE
jgi:putative FmdB family regulatory protein